MSEVPGEVSIATLAGIAGASGADPEIDEVMYAPVSDVDNEGIHSLGEGINTVPSE